MKSAVIAPLASKRFAVMNSNSPPAEPNGFGSLTLTVAKSRAPQKDARSSWLRCSTSFFACSIAGSRPPYCSISTSVFVKPHAVRKICV